MARIIGTLISGGAVRLFSIGIAIYVGHYGYTVLVHSLNTVNTALSAVQ